MATSRVCSIPECGKPHDSRGYCTTHYQRLLRNGTTEISRAYPGDRLRFVEGALLLETDECVVWPYSVAGDFYPKVNVDGVVIRANRYVCEKKHGPPPSPDMLACHSCGDRKCVNHRHLRWGTLLDNAADALAHGSQVRGERQAKTTITEATAKLIKYAPPDARQIDLVRQHRTTRAVVQNIRSGRTWRHI